MKLLLIDDDNLLLEFLAKKLRDEGYAVDLSCSGEEGLFKAQNNNYDAIALDVVMPGVDGWKVLQELRKTKKTPVVMLTARKALADKVSGLNTGADDYLVKPFKMPELLARLRALIRRAAYNDIHSRVEIDEVTIDFAARLVSFMGSNISLSPREYGIVEYLATHRGKVITRTALYEHVFDENDDSLSNVIDVHVGKIRKKLGRNLIVTHHGHGYSIRA
jgi:two-component system OmpR family response regulator